MFLFACDCQEFPFGSLGEETFNEIIHYAKDKSIQRYEA